MYSLSVSFSCYASVVPSGRNFLAKTLPVNVFGDEPASFAYNEITTLFSGKEKDSGLSYVNHVIEPSIAEEVTFSRKIMWIVHSVGSNSI